MAESTLQGFFYLLVNGEYYYNSYAENLSATLTQLPPAPGTFYQGTDVVELRDTYGNLPGISFQGMIYEPNPVGGNGILHGTVSDVFSLNPISGVRVAILQSSLELDSRTTGPDGTYSFDPLPVGTYE